MVASESNGSKSKDEIVQAFAQVTAQQKALASRIVTAQEAAESAAARETVTAASAFTVETIVKGLAELQLHFSDTIERVTRQLGSEAARLEQLQRAIGIETAFAQRLADIMVAADALDILKQEHREQVKHYTDHDKAHWMSFEAEQRDTRGDWSAEQGRHDARVAQHAERTARERAKAEADYTYELARQRKVDADRFADKRTTTERTLAEQDAANQKSFAAREAVLAQQARELAAHKARLEAFPQELDEAVKRAREEAIKEGAADARVRAELLEKETEANRKVYAMQIESLEQTLAKQAEQVDALQDKLRLALDQVQQLAIRAVEGTAPAPSIRRGVAAA